MVRQLLDKDILGHLSNSEEAAPPSIITSSDESYFQKLACKVLIDERDYPFVLNTMTFMGLVASSLYMIFVKFTWFQFALHLVAHLRCNTTYILMLHCVNHKAIYKPEFKYLNNILPYVIAPFLGQTWDTFYYHHVKHHHVEDNGPGDLSSTLQYERDNALHFIHYFLRFFLLAWVELPLYFWNKGWKYEAMRAFAGEFFSLSFFVVCGYIGNFKACCLLFWLPFVLTRFGMMSGNWGQHAFIHRERPKDDYVQSLTCINVSYNEIAFNDGYHTSHHLHPKRHWADHPGNLVENKATYAEKGTIVFQGLDFWMVWFALMSHNYAWLARSYVDLGGKGKDEVAIQRMLKERTRPFSDAEVIQHYGRPMTKPVWETAFKD